jgi:NAD-dependent deacetylase
VTIQGQRRRQSAECRANSEFGSLAARLRGTPRVTVLTGAGISVASGVPTFRGAAGAERSGAGGGAPALVNNALWRNFRPEELATPQAFARDPRLVWEWYDWRRQRIAACRPNRGHDVLAAWSQRLARFMLITQNVDGLHERSATRNVVRLHGSIWKVRCVGGCGERDDDRVPLPEIPPRCACGALLRPAVVWFGESLDPRILRQADAALDCDVFLTIGTSSVVYPAAGLAHEAKRRGAFTAEINLEPTPASELIDLAIHAPAEEVLDAIERALTRA